MRNSLSRQILLSIFGLAILVIAIVGVSYAVMVTSYNDSNLNVIHDGRVLMSSSRASNQFLISSQFAMNDFEGMRLVEGDNVFDFNVSSLVDRNSTVNYQIVLEKVDIDGNELDSNSIRLYLEKLVDGEYVAAMPNAQPRTFAIDNSLESMVLYSGSFQNDNIWKRNFTDSYRLRVWVSEDEKFNGIDKSFQLRICVYDNNL